MRQLLIAAVCAAATTASLAKLPPLSDEAKAKAAEAAAKTAHGNKVADFQLCKAMERVATRYAGEAGKAGKSVTPTPTPACVDPGPFGTAAPAAAPAAPAAPAVPAPAPAKKT